MTEPLLGLLDYRKYVVILRSKGDDVVYNAKRVHTALPHMTDPKLVHIEIFPKRGHEFKEFAVAFDLAWKQKGWTIYIDEMYHADKLLRLRPDIEDALTRWRSSKMTLVNGLQRPVSVSRFAISQSKHVISFAQEGRDAKTVGEATSPRIVPILEALGEYQFAWFERRSKRIEVGRLQDLQDGRGGLSLPFTWNPGEHMTVIGDTGSGKSTLMGGLSK